MKSYKDLEKVLQRIDYKGYKTYKDLQGEYSFEGYVLAIDHVQSDPFAPPSRIRVILPQEQGKFPSHLYDQYHRKVATVDFLTRLFEANIHKYYSKFRGSGKSGLLSIGWCGQQVLDRTSIHIDQSKLEARLEVGLPAAGRKVLAKAASEILFEAIPSIIKKTLYYAAIDQNKLDNHVKLVEDQQYIRQELSNRNLVAFIANGSVLPRESGVSDKPLKDGGTPFTSPPSFEVKLNLPHKGKLKGMGIPEGITLITGGGYHGKSTLLKALERGVYNHLKGDGREYVIALDNAVKIRAEDGRNIEKTNISPFINNLPNGKDTYKFSTENASGSTSQAANIVEAMEIGTNLLLIDEDTSATNFMIRDERMRQLVSNDKEPITPFIDRVKELYQKYNVSTVLVIGGSGDYFPVADNVIMMDSYIPIDVTHKAKEISANLGPYKENLRPFQTDSSRILLKSSFPTSHKGVKVKAKDIKTITYNKLAINLDYIEQLVDFQQTNAISFMISYIAQRMVDDKASVKTIVDELYKHVKINGLEVIFPFKGHPGNLALPRKQELVFTLNRYRDLKIN